MTRLLLAVDGGNSKTDLALLTPDGTVVAAARGGTVSHQQVGVEEAGRGLRALLDRAASDAGLQLPAPAAAVGVLCLAGMDLPADERTLRGVHGATGIAGTIVLENDTIAGLRAGSPGGWGVGVVVGQGINGVGVAPDGRRARFAGLGTISGDRGGGAGLGMDALGAAVRGQDGRGPRTALERIVPAHFGLRRPLDVTNALYTGRLPEGRIAELARVAVEAGREGDPVALALVDDLAGECAAFAMAAIRRLRLARLAVPVVLSGGVARGAGELLAGRVAARVRAVAPSAEVTVLHAPPVLGAALLALDREAPGAPEAAERVRSMLTHERLTARRAHDPRETPR
ncbi:MAG TPA: BadF/BadG/BcrA/BcrD ATPase family protein [Candidatus Limnocylindrales bacterium]|nr:BadF/BadG/BcrA/BcrD ATPase family protein [Candidatus Limnocylindrales bacterium]